MDRIKATEPEMPWRDDSLEIMLDPSRERRGHLQFVVTATGARKAFVHAIAGEMPAWPEPARWDSAAAKGSGGWTVEMAIPWIELGVVARPGLALRANFARNQQPLPEKSSWTPRHVAGSSQVVQFGDVVLEGTACGAAAELQDAGCPRTERLCPLAPEQSLLFSHHVLPGVRGDTFPSHSSRQVAGGHAGTARCPRPSERNPRPRPCHSLQSGCHGQNGLRPGAAPAPQFSGLSAPLASHSHRTSHRRAGVGLHLGSERHVQSAPRRPRPKQRGDAVRIARPGTTLSHTRSSSPPAGT